MLLLFAVSLANISLSGLRIVGFASKSPFIANQMTLIARSRFSQFLAPILFASRVVPLKLAASSFTRFQSSVVCLSSLTFRDNRFERYWTEGNGATLSFTGPYLEAIGCLFMQNAAGSDGGAIWMDNKVGKLVVTQCVFLENSATRRGGGIAAEAHSVSVTNTFFDGNAAGEGSHIFVSSALEVSLEGNTFVRAASDAMAVTVTDRFTMSRCTFHNNTGAVNLTFTRKDASVTVAGSCFAAGTFFMSVVGPSADAAITITNSCFEAPQSDAIHANCQIAKTNTTFGNCSACHYNPNTPAPTPTTHARISDPAIIACLAVIVFIVVIALVGSVMMGFACKRRVHDLRWSMSLSQSGYEEISHSSALQRPLDIPE